MKLYNSMGPNPRVVRMFMQELGLECEVQAVDLMAGENRQADYVAKVPTGTLPGLELDNGKIISEITAICEYLDEIQGGTDLIGLSPEARAETRMWVRRIDLAIAENMTNGFRFSEGLRLFESRMTTIPQAADVLKQIAQEKLVWLNELIAGKSYICAERFSLADILLFSFLDFFAAMGQPLNTDLEHIIAWFERVKARPSVEASAAA